MRPENHGKLWTTEETIQLMKEIKLIDIKQIAINHKRTENAIFLKLIREAARLSINDNQLTLYDLSLITSIKISNIIEGFKKINYNKFNIIDFDNDNDNGNDNGNGNGNDNEYDNGNGNENDNEYDNGNDNEYKYNYKYYLIIPTVIIISLMLFWKD